MREFGDFQTPAGLVESVIRVLYSRDRGWTRALEPTCGLGSFVRGLSSLAHPPHEIQAIEIQRSYSDRVKIMAQNFSPQIIIRVHEQDLFKTNLAELPWSDHGPMLVVGNPPWVTNSELGTIGSENLPAKSNLKKLRGMEAMTGDANFDIAEYIWIKLIKELSWANPTIALLCKTAVARNVLRFAKATNLPVSNGELHRIDAKKWFNAATDACLFKLDVGGEHHNYTAAVYANLNATEPETILSITNGALIANTDAYKALSFLEGVSPLEWRQGVKHDLAALMELRKIDGEYKNKRDDVVEIEDEYAYPLLKSSDLHSSNRPIPRYHVIIPQRHLGDDPIALTQRAPRLWAYLNKHVHEFRGRKSSIYEERPDFSIFGIGPYSFADYKVAVSGLYKNIRFRLLAPYGGRPVMLDDTCYFVPCESVQQACVLNELLNHEASLSFLNAIVFKDSKRPLTKRVLQRLNLKTLLDHVDKSRLLTNANQQLELLQADLVPDTVTLDGYLYLAEEPQSQIPLL